jgi:hypothetical protein
MSFSVQVTPDLVPLEAGATTPISVVVVNKGTEADRYEMEIEGIDPEWKAVPVGVFGVDAEETHTEKVFFKPPRASESLAGNYPFVVRVRSLISGDSRTVQGVAQVKPFHHLSMEIDPKKGFISPTRKQNIFDVTLVNLGNTEHTLQLLANDPEDACAYEFDQEQVTIGPGQQRDVELVADPTTKPIFSGGRLIGFTVSARSSSAPSVVASAQAQLEQRPLLTPTTLAVFVLLVLLFGAWFMMMPKPPAITLAVTPQRALQGTTVTVNWDAEHAKRVIVRAGNEEIYNGTEPRGQMTYPLTTPGVVTFVAQAINGDRKVDDTQEVTVETPAPVPPPRILSLSASPTRVRLGEPFVMKYSLSDNVTEAVLQPTGERIDQVLNEQEVRPERTGQIQYTLVVKNSVGEVARKSFTVSVYDESDARILEFRPSAKNVPAADARVTITWQVIGAERVELKAGSNEASVVGPSGSQEFVLGAKTTFTLSAIDAKGRPVSRQTTVVVDVPPPTPPDTGGTTATGTDAGSTAATGGDTTGGTTTGGTATTGNTTGGPR